MELDRTSLSTLTASDQYIFSLFGRGPPAHTPFETVHQAVLYHSRQTPGAIAVRDISCYPPRELSYSELAEYAIYLARALKRAGISPGSRVPLIARRGLEMVVGIVGTLLAGAQYVPLDGGVAPDATLHHVIKECGEDGVLLVTESTEERLASAPIIARTLLVLEKVIDQARAIRENVDTEVLTDEILRTGQLGCYVIYTSGKTICKS
jgi:acyl-CoA synthetase (AMP-forming)/AMP-acid ligase II